jgi:preprotein translocase subunit SecA
MDYLREGIHLRGFAQIEPIIAYKNEAFTLFQDLMNTIWADFARMIYNVEVRVEGENGAADAVPQQQGGPAALQYSGGTLDDQPSVYEDEGEELAVAPVIQQRRVEENEQLGRNDPCWCGSGKKYKKCHGA